MLERRRNRRAVSITDVPLQTARGHMVRTDMMSFRRKPRGFCPQRRAQARDPDSDAFTFCPSRFHLNDLSVPLHNRCVTFECGEKHSDTYPLAGNSLAETIQARIRTALPSLAA